MEPHREMQIHLIRYCAARKRNSLRLLIAGACALFLATVLLARREASKSMAWPLGIVALYEIWLGTSTFRVDRGMASLSRQLEAAPASYRDRELAKLEMGMAGLPAFKALAAAGGAAGLALLALIRPLPALGWTGLGCLLQGSILLVFLLAAEKEGRSYEAAIRRLLG